MWFNIDLIDSLKIIMFNIVIMSDDLVIAFTPMKENTSLYIYHLREIHKHQG